MTINTLLSAPATPDRAAIIERITDRQQILDQARKALKDEFIGIEEIIDSIINAASSWFQFPEAQERPVVINLWGMTGVGKSAVVGRLADLLSCKDQYFRFDLGDKMSSYSFSETVADLLQRDSAEPMIVVLDEFQHTRTLDQMGIEISEDRNRVIWELMDSGTVRTFAWNWGLGHLERFAEILKGLLERGIEIEKGMITKGLEMACKELPNSEKREKDTRLVDPETLKTIFELVGAKLGFALRQDVEKHLETLSGGQIYRFFMTVLKVAQRPIEKRFSQLLVFVLGNLDEAFPMTREFSSDVDADIFYRQSTKIGLPEIKEALQKRFRSEQIARLGNIHVIYPAIRKSTFEQFISKGLRRLSENAHQRLGIEVRFDDSVHRAVYEEGVCPTQGFRPLISTIHQLVASNLGHFFSDRTLWDLGIAKLSFSVCEKHLWGEGVSRNGERFCKSIPLPMPLTERRAGKDCDLRAISAVHESGHVLAHILLEKRIPVVVCSTSSEPGVGGFTIADGERRKYFRHELIPLIACKLAGNVAEKLVFGSEFISSGSSSDIESATELASQLIKQFGFGSLPLRYGVNEVDKNPFFHDMTVESEMKTAIAAGLELAEQALRSEWLLLLQLADRLTRVRELSRDEIIALCREYAVTELACLNGAVEVSGTGYRRKLDEKIEQFQRSRQLADEAPASCEVVAVAG